MIGALGSQIAASAGAVTRQATSGVGIDWQVQLNHGVDPGTLRAEIARATPVTKLLPVWYADVAGFEATQRNSTQTTGAGRVVGLPDGYFAAFPDEVG